MSDQPQIHIDPTEGSQLRLKQASARVDAGKLFISVTGDNGVVATTYIPPATLLAMIDAADPEAMRAYLSEQDPTDAARHVATTAKLNHSLCAIWDDKTTIWQEG